MRAVEFRGCRLVHIDRLTLLDTGSPVVMSLRFAAPALGVMFLLTACGSRPAMEEPVGEAFAGPVSLNLRQDLAGRSPAVTAVKHGERLDILEVRRRFMRVRTKDGTEGWTDSNLLLSSLEMEQLAGLEARAATLPSQGAASVFDALNMHPEPKRQSPSFFQIPEGGAVEVVGHVVRPRVQPNSRAPAAERARKAPPKKKAKAKQNVLLIPPPRPPAPPAKWELARPRVYDLPGFAAPAPPPPIPLDDWSLVRTPEGKAGWVLSRMLFMAVPDEVAQYAEGHRITAYLPLGEVKDGNDIKKIWLWTTASPGVRETEFDSFRVFVWSSRRHRYETAYVERDVKGYFPVEVVSIPGQQEKGFALVMEEQGGGGRVSKRDVKRAPGAVQSNDEASVGKLYRRTYAFAGFRVHLLAKEPYQRPAADAAQIATTPAVSPPAAQESWHRRISAWAQRWWARRRLP